MVYACAVIGNQLQPGRGFVDQFCVDTVGYGGHEDITIGHRRCKGIPAQRFVAIIKAGVKKLRHAHFDSRQQFTRHRKARALDTGKFGHRDCLMPILCCRQATTLEV